MLRRSILALLAATVLHTAAFAQMSHKHGADTACDDVALRCASKVTPAFAPDGTLVLTWMAGGHVLVAHSTDLGRTLSDPVRVTRDNMNLDWGPDARPKIAITKTGVVALAFSTFRDKAFNGQVFTTTSRDNGRSFADIKPITSTTAMSSVYVSRSIRHGRATFRTILISPDTTAETIEGTVGIPDLETWAARQKRAAR